MRKLKKTMCLLFFINISCLKIDCVYLEEKARQRECLIIFEKLATFSTYKLDAKGKHLLSKKNCQCTEEGRWWVQYKDYLSKGDTIIKRKGELIFSIHKKDTVLNFNWECEGKIYK